MARSLSIIYDSIVAEKNNQAELLALQPEADNVQSLLADITTTSKVADWRLWCFIVAFSIWTHEMLWDVFKVEVDSIAAKAVPGTLEWYRQQCLDWQYGDTLVLIDNKYQYIAINESKKIVNYAAVLEVSGRLYLKVAKDNLGFPQELSVTELVSFSSYMAKKKFAGTFLTIVSRPADLVWIEMDVYYNPLLLKSNGELISSPGVKPAEDAISAHLKSLPFNGALNLTKLVDSVQAATGVIDPVLTLAKAKYGLLSYADIAVEYLPDAGYMKIDPDHALSVTLNYIAKI